MAPCRPVHVTVCCGVWCLAGAFRQLVYWLAGTGSLGGFSASGSLASLVNLASWVNLVNLASLASLANLVNLQVWLLRRVRPVRSAGNLAHLSVLPVCLVWRIRSSIQFGMADRFVKFIQSAQPLRLDCLCATP